jgi:hypothetical protein
MPARSDKPDPFYHWLVDEKGLSPASARVYKSFVRSTIMNLGDHASSQEGVDAYFMDLKDSHNPSESNIRAAWAKFVEFTEGQGTTLPLPSKRSKSGRSQVRLPITVREALRLLRVVGRPSLREVTAIRWRDVDVLGLTTSAGRYQKVNRPGRPGESIHVASEILRAFREWAQPHEDGSTPLIPTRPGGMEPVTLGGLLAESRRHEPD